MRAHTWGFVALVAARRRIGLLRVAIALAGYLGACWAFVVLRDESLFLSVLTIFGVSLLAIRLNRVVRREFEDGVSTSWERWIAIGLVAAVGAGLLVAWRIADGLDGAGFFGIALLYVAIGIGLEELRRWQEVSWWLFGGVLAVSVAVTLVAVGAVAVGVERALVVALVVGVVGVPIGVTLVSELTSRALKRQPTRLSLGLAAAGLAGMGVTFAAMLSTGVGNVYVIMFGASVLMLMLGLVARSSVDVVFVIAAAALVWTLAHRSVPEPEALRPEADEPVVVAFGDSFISGEGAEEFFEGTNQPGVSTCRRAPTAYPVLLIEESVVDVPDNLAFFACSGAKAKDIDAQVAGLRERLGPPDDDIRFVLLSIGGNDALFGTIAQACLLPVDCTTLEPAWLAHLDDVRQTLDDLYLKLTEDLPGIPVVVVPYPEPISPQTCGSSAFSNAEHQFLHAFTRHLNDTVTAAATNAGFAVVDTMPSALQGLRLCDGRAADVGVNFLVANSVLGTLEQSANPTNWIHNSLHPNARGHHAMNGALVSWLGQNPDLTPAPEAVPAPDRAEMNGTCLTAADLEGCTGDWMARESARWLLTRGPIAVPAVVGAWLVALQLLRLWWSIFFDTRA